MLPARTRTHIVTGMAVVGNAGGDQRAALWELVRRMTRQDAQDCMHNAFGTLLSRDETREAADTIRSTRRV